MAWIKHCKNSDSARRNSWIQCDSNENCSYLCMLSLWIQGEKTSNFIQIHQSPWITKQSKQKEHWRRYDHNWFSNMSVTATQRAWHWQYARLTDPCAQIPHNYRYLIFERMAKIYIGKKPSTFSKQFWENSISTCNKMKLDPIFHHTWNWAPNKARTSK